MAPRPIDAKAAERCASIAGAKQKGNEPPASHAPVTDVALSSFPQNATLAVNDRDGDPGADDRCPTLTTTRTGTPNVAVRLNSDNQSL